MEGGGHRTEAALLAILAKDVQMLVDLLKGKFFSVFDSNVAFEMLSEVVGILI